MPLLVVKFFFFLLLFLAIFPFSVRADRVNFGDTFPYEIYHNDYNPSYCLHTYEQIIDDTPYLCKKIYVIPIHKESPIIWGRHHCWQFAYGGWYGGWGGNRSDGIITSQQFDYTPGLPSGYDSSKPCVPKQQVSPEACNINVQSIVNQAFSQKFPLDLFSNIRVVPVSPACPSFTVTGQTFSLCYLNKLTASLKYVLLLVFIITSVINL